MAAKSKPIDTLTSGDVGVTPVGWAGANQTITDVSAAPAREAGEKVEDDGTAHERVVAFLESLKLV